MARDAWLTLLYAARSAHGDRWQRVLAAFGSAEGILAAPARALERIKEREHRGYHYEAADGSSL